MNWIDHLTVPLGMMFALIAIVGGFWKQRTRRLGIDTTETEKRIGRIFIPIVIAGLIFAGVILEHTWGH